MTGKAIGMGDPLGFGGQPENGPAIKIEGGHQNGQATGMGGQPK